MPNTKIEKYIIQLDFLRFIAAIWVVFFHYFNPLHYINVQIPIFDRFINNGNLAVDFFFILSGFLLTHVEINRPSDNFLSFYKKRLLRILPIYYIALILSAFLIWDDLTFKAVIYNIFCIQIFDLQQNYINSPAWAISQLFIFYLIFPFIFRAIKKNIATISLILGSIIIVLLISNHHFLKITLFNISQPYWIINTFLIGIFSRGILESKSVAHFFKRYYKLILFGALLLFFIGVNFFDFNFWEGIGYTYLAYALIIVSLSYYGPTEKIFLKNKKLSYLGNLSYAIFIFQHPIYVICSNFFTQRPRVNFLFYLIVLLIFSWFVYEYIEKKIRTMKVKS